MKSALQLLETSVEGKQAIETANQEYSRDIIVDYATTANITLSGLQNIDGGTGVANQRILVKSNTTASQN